MTYENCTPPQPKTVHYEATPFFPAETKTYPAEWLGDVCLDRDNRVGSYGWEIANLTPCQS